MAKKQKQPITLDQFRSWLDGVEEMQPQSWTPDKLQWKRIREKIDLIQQPEPQQYNPPLNQIPSAALPQQSALPPQQADYPHTEIVDEELKPFDAPPAIPLSDIANMDVTPSTPALSTNGRGQLKTPDIDTSAGKYVSSLE